MFNEQQQENLPGLLVPGVQRAFFVGFEADYYTIKDTGKRVDQLIMYYNHVPELDFDIVNEDKENPEKKFFHTKYKLSFRTNNVKNDFLKLKEFYENIFGAIEFTNPEDPFVVATKDADDACEGIEETDIAEQIKRRLPIFARFLTSQFKDKAVYLKVFGEENEWNNEVTIQPRAWGMNFSPVFVSLNKEDISFDPAKDIKPLDKTEDPMEVELPDTDDNVEELPFG